MSTTSKATVILGFQLPDEDIWAVTGFCAASMAVAEANAADDLPVTLALEPIIDKRTKEVARAGAAAFAMKPEAVGVLGPLNSDMALATQDIYRKAGFAQLTSEASSPLLTREAHGNFFRLVANDEHQGRALAQAAVSLIHAKRIAVLHDNSGWGRPIAEIFSAEAEALGVKPVLIRGFGTKELALDFDELIAATLAAKPDLVYYAVYWNKAHIIAHRLRDAGNKAVFLGSDALKPYAFLEVPSLDATPPYHSLAGVDMRLKPSARSFMERFAVAYPTMMAAPQYAAEAYDCASLLIEGIRRAETVDRASVLASVQGIRDFTGAIGTITFDANGDLVEPEIGLYRCENGQRRFTGAIRDLIQKVGAA